jgi:hypothetical protein
MIRRERGYDRIFLRDRVVVIIGGVLVQQATQFSFWFFGWGPGHCQCRAQYQKELYNITLTTNPQFVEAIVKVLLQSCFCY